MLLYTIHSYFFFSIHCSQAIKADILGKIYLLMLLLVVAVPADVCICC